VHEKKVKGDLGVAFVIARLVELGWNVGVPLTEHAPYDLFAECEGEVHTVQVRYTAPADGVIRVKLSTSWSDRHGNHRRPRCAGQFSMLAIYAPGCGVFFVSDEDLGDNCREVCLRLTRSKNNQTRGVRMAESYRVPCRRASSRISAVRGR
jgi:hypothetical protein